MADLWKYRAHLDRLVDGDTLDVVIDLGFRVTTHQRLRLAEVNTPEVRGAEREAGLAATTYVQNWLDECDAGKDMPGWPLLVETGKTGKYGRWIAYIYSSSPGRKSLNEAITDAGFNKTMNYGPGNWA